MYKNLNLAALGVSGRQSELIELALTYGFRGMDVDMADLMKRAKSKGVEHACRYIASAISMPLRIGGFSLPICLNASDADFTASLSKLDSLGQIAQAISATRCLVVVAPTSDSLPYHENFERHRKRLGEVGDRLGKFSVRLGVGLNAASDVRGDKQFQFIQKFEELLTLIKNVGSPNVGLLLDTWDWRAGGGGLDQIDELDANQIVAVRLADAPGGVDLAHASRTDRILPSEFGQIDTTGVLRRLVAKEYKGPVTPWPSAVQFKGMTREAIVQEARTRLESEWVAIGLSSARPAAVAVAAQDTVSEDEAGEVEAEE